MRTTREKMEDVLTMAPRVVAVLEEHERRSRRRPTVTLVLAMRGANNAEEQAMITVDEPRSKNRHYKHFIGEGSHATATAEFRRLKKEVRV